MKSGNGLHTQEPEPKILCMKSEIILRTGQDAEAGEEVTKRSLVAKRHNFKIRKHKVHQTEVCKRKYETHGGKNKLKNSFVADQQKYKTS